MNQEEFRQRLLAGQLIANSVKSEEVKDGTLTVKYTGVIKQEVYTKETLEKLIKVQNGNIARASAEIERLRGIQKRITSEEVK